MMSWEMGFLWVHLSFGFLLVFLHNGNALSDCDFFNGSWVLDQYSDPLYEPETCPFIQREFTCLKNGRPDRVYTQYKWQPRDCDLTRFDGKKFLKKYKGKSIMFVGDSLSRNQWQSLTCMLHSAVPNTKYNLTRVGDVSIFTFMDYEVKVMLDRNVGPTQPWDYMEEDKKIMKDMDRMVAFEKALTTWTNWVDTNIDPTKVQVFFQGISPSHYNGGDWNEDGVKSCVGQKTAAVGSTYPGGLPPAVAVVKNVLSKMKKPVKLLDITTLSLLRKDGHPSIYGVDGRTGMDCTHWCLAGVPDTWNQILYNLIL
ncbi:Trichome birefringence-like family [Quillaja saponaria]|uniref:Trichome birefringence-like family n=1 Tax=Quillaja saponaria TaxID=32244 RepID=A0AAD7L0X7_QUISA|nr:Trichome birefringence-like family [Quillaja saponaria]